MRRGGFTLVEIMVSMVLFAAVMLGLTGLQIVESVQSARQSVRIRATAALASRTEGWQSIPFASLPNSGTTGTCGIDSTSAPGGLRFFRCDTVVVVSVDQRRISVNVLAPVTQKPGAVTRIPSDSNLIALQFVRLNSVLLRTRSPTSPF